MYRVHKLPDGLEGRADKLEGLEFLCEGLGRLDRMIRVTALMEGGTYGLEVLLGGRHCSGMAVRWYGTKYVVSPVAVRRCYRVSVDTVSFRVP